jgi:hypothetical protein
MIDRVLALVRIGFAALVVAALVALPPGSSCSP